MHNSRLCKCFCCTESCITDEVSFKYIFPKKRRTKKSGVFLFYLYTPISILRFKLKHIVPFIFAFATTGMAQVSDYKLYQDSVFNICRIYDDSLSLTNSIHQLQGLDTAKIIKNKDLYYRDLGFLNYKYYVISNDANSLRTAITLYQRGLSFEPKNTLLLHDLIVFSFLRKNYSDCITYYNQLKQVSKPDKDSKALYKKAKSRLH